jgi:hypothetical protein
MADTKKALTLFDHIGNLTDKKVPWNSLSEMDRKSFSVYMVNRFLSMNPDMIEFVNELQKYTISVLSPKEVYNLYLEILPKKKMFLKYIKGDAKEKYSDKLIEYVSKYFECSNKESVEYLDIYYCNEKYKAELTSILQKFGLTDKEIKKLI